MTSSTRSQSARRYWIALTTHSRVSLTPSCSAIFSPSSIWNPATGPALLANGSALGLAQSVNVPRSITASSERAFTGTSHSISSETLTAYRIRRYPGWNVLVIEPPDVSQDCDDLAFAEHRSIGRHGGRQPDDRSRRWLRTSFRPRCRPARLRLAAAHLQCRARSAVGQARRLAAMSRSPW